MHPFTPHLLNVVVDNNAIIYCIVFNRSYVLFTIYVYIYDNETRFSDTAYAFLIAFLTIIPIWLLSWCISRIRPHDFSDEEIDELIEDRMPIDTRNSQWENDYSSDEEGMFTEHNEWSFQNENIFAPPEIISGQETEQMNSGDIQRIFTDIDEEVEYLEENYMPVQSAWKDKPSVAYPLSKLGYDNVSTEESISSIEERIGFQGMEYHSHWNQARDAANLGFVPINPETNEYDVNASNVLKKMRSEQIQYHRKKKHERESSISSKISSLFSSDKRDKKSKKKNRRGSSRLSGIFGFGSNKNDDNDNVNENIDIEDESNKYDDISKYEEDEVEEVVDSEHNEEEDEFYESEEEEEEEEDDDEYYESEEDEDEDNEQNERHRNSNKKPATSSMYAPKPMYAESRKKSKKDKKGKNIQMQRLKQHQNMNKREREKEEYTNEEIESAKFIKSHLICNRKYDQFNRVLQIARMYKDNIYKDRNLLTRIVDQSLVAGEKYLYHSGKLVRRCNKLIKQKHVLFDSIEKGATTKNQKQIAKMVRRGDVIRTVFANVESDNNTGAKNFAYSPSELRKLDALPERAPSQRPPVERETNIEDDVWLHTNEVYDTRVIEREDRLRDNNPNIAMMKENRKNDAAFDFSRYDDFNQEIEFQTKKQLNLDDIWEVTGALPPEMLSKLEDPYDAWKENELKPIQKAMRDDDEQEYRNKMRYHYKKRRDLLRRKYCLPYWCKYIVWTIVILLLILFIILFLFEGNKLGATFLWTPEEFQDTNCAISISEQIRFDYDYSRVEAERRNPACSPQEIAGSMPHCWDYRVRFSLGIVITFVTSIILVQPLYIAILVLLILSCLPHCKQRIDGVRNCLFGVKPGESGFKEFVGGTTMISGDIALEYGSIDDNSMRYQSANEEKVEHDLDMEDSDIEEIPAGLQHGSKRESKTQPLLAH